ncbi:MAG: redoxin domain-containing protein, partial [Gammaproteobacteria bacterium]|nr:redoxin domain-containing protein [Gammaproteobacteria bacterium]
SEIEAAGVSVVVILNEEPEDLASFELKYDIPYLMLADVDSKVIRQFGLFNTNYEPETRYYGVPYPGVFLLDENGVIVKKLAEESYRERPLFSELVKAAQTLNQQP